MADHAISRATPLQGWQRDNIVAAASFLRAHFGNPPADARAKVVHDGLLEVLDPSRRAVRVQKEMSNAGRSAALTAKPQRRASDRRASDRRKANLGPPRGVQDRRKGERRTGADRRTKR